MERVREDRERAAPRLEEFLQRIEGSLFDRGLTVGAIRQSCRVGDNSIGSVFKTVIGVAPSMYVLEARLEVSVRLLRDTEIEIGVIADRLGFGSPGSFSRSFGKMFQVRPRDFRKSIRAVEVRLGPLGVEMCSVGFLRRVVEGRLDEEEATQFAARLEAVYELRPNKQCDGIERPEGATGVWRSVRSAPFEVTRATVRRKGTRALFDLLLEESREEGRWNSRRGVELANLAVESLNGFATRLGETIHDLRALGWACLGNAWRLVPDLGEAESAFVRSAAEWSTPRAHPDPYVEAQIWNLRASLRLFQRRPGEALELANRAIERLRVLGCVSELAVVLLERSRIRSHLDQPEAAITDLREILEVTEEEDRELRLTAYQHLAIAFVQAGWIQAASEALGQAKRLFSLCGHPKAWFQVQWTEGLLYQKKGDAAAAEERFASARAGLLDIGQDGDAAAVALDLLILLAEQGRQTEALPLAAEVITAFEAFGIHREPLAALKLIRKAVETGKVSAALLYSARKNLCR